MTALTQPCCTLTAALVEEPSEALLPASGTLGAVHGTTWHAVVPVIHTLGEVIHPYGVSAKHTAAVISKAAITCHSGVSGRVTHL